MKLRIRFVLTLLVTSLVIVVAGLTMGLVLNSNLEEASLSQAKGERASFVARQAERHLSPAIFSDPDLDSHKEDFISFFEEIRTDDIIRIKIWNTNATVIYSDDPNKIGQSFPDNKEYLSAIKGEIEAEINPPVKPDNIVEKGYGQLMELYVPVQFAGSSAPSGVVEAYTTLDALNEKIGQAQRQLWAVVGTTTIASVVISVLLGIILSRSIVKPIEILQKAAKKIGGT